MAGLSFEMIQKHCDKKGLCLVPQQDLGLRRLCQECQTRFYDLKRKPPVCPKCNATFEAIPLLKSKRGKTAVKESTPIAPVFDPLEELEFDVGEPDSVDEDVLIEDADDLGDDTDVVSGIDHHSEKEG